MIKRHPNAKVTPEIVRWIRRAYQGGNCTLIEIGKEIGLTKGAVSRIVNSLTWKEVTGAGGRSSSEKQDRV